MFRIVIIGSTSVLQLASRFEPLKVGAPFIVLLCARFVQILPGIKAGIVAIIKKEAQRVIPDGFDRRYLHVLLVGLQNALTYASSRSNKANSRLHARSACASL